MALGTGEGMVVRDKMQEERVNVYSVVQATKCFWKRTWRCILLLALLKTQELTSPAKNTDFISNSYQLQQSPVFLTAPPSALS